MFNKTNLLKAFLFLMILSVNSYLMYAVNMVNKDYNLFTQKIHFLVEYELIEMEKASFIFDKEKLKELITVISEREYDIDIHSTYFYILHILIVLNFIVLIAMSIYGFKYEAFKKNLGKC